MHPSCVLKMAYSTLARAANRKVQDRANNLCLRAPTFIVYLIMVDHIDHNGADELPNSSRGDFENSLPIYLNHSFLQMLLLHLPCNSLPSFPVLHHPAALEQGQLVSEDANCASKTLTSFFEGIPQTEVTVVACRMQSGHGMSFQHCLAALLALLLCLLSHSLTER